MNQRDNDFIDAIWDGAGWELPDDREKERASLAWERAMALGRAVPRTEDKTVTPMLGPRTDIEKAARNRGRS